MKHHIAILSATAFANAAPAAPATPAATAAAKAGAPKAEDRILPIFTAPRKIEMPLVASGGRNGIRTELAAQLAPLEVGFSIGLKNKTKKQISTQLSKIQNDASNLTVTEKAGEPIIDANGVVVGTKPATVVKEQNKVFTAIDRDPKTDEDGASVRIWRTK